MSLANNTAALEELLKQANNLPDAGEGAAPVVEALEITENGTYTAPDGVDGYSPITVDVPIPDGYIIPSGTKEITENGTHDVTEYASVNINVEVARSIVERTIESYSDSEVTSVGGYAFNECKALVSANLPKVTKIETYAFNGCASLVEVDTSSLNTLNTYALNKCVSLRALILRNTAKVCTLSNVNALNYTLVANGKGLTLVPASLVDSYKAATNWSTYADQICVLEDYTVDGTTTGEVLVYTVTYSLPRVASTNTAVFIGPNSSYITTLASTNENAIEYVVVLMGGVDITSDVYDAETGEVNIPLVTGDLVVKARVDAVGDFLYDWDLTRSVTDENGVSLTLSGATQGVTGVTIADANDYIRIPYTPNNVSFTIEVDVAEYVRQSTSHGRMIMCSGDCGFIYRSSGVWALYLGSWTNSAISDVAYLNGKTVQFHCEAAGSNTYYISVYVDGELLVSHSTAYTLTSSNQFMIGSSGSQSAYKLVVSSLRVKEEMT